MAPARKVYSVWLGLGIAVFAHSLFTSRGGIPGLLLYLELKWFGWVFVITTPFLGVVLIGVPAVFLLKGLRRRYRAPVDRREMGGLLVKRSAIAAILFAAAAGLLYWRTTLLPSPDRPARQLSLNDLPEGAAVDAQHCVIAGALQRKYRVRYEEVLSGRSTNVSFRHSFTPITRSDWTPSKPVRFLADAPYAGEADASGLLLRGHLPSYVRRALEQKGLRVGRDVMVFSTDPDFGRTAWEVATAFSAIGVFVSLVLALVWSMVSKRTEQQMDGFRVRAPAYLLFLTGLMPVVVGIALSAQKAVLIATATKADGIVEDVQESPHSLGKYSFYVGYSTPQGRFHQFAFTSTPFSKSSGDKVTVLYNPGDPGHPELLTFDTDWLLCTLLFAVAAAFIVPGAIFLARSTRAGIDRRKL
jgi:hypothetical protein